MNAFERAHLFSSEDRSVPWFDVTFDRHVVQVEVNGLKLPFLIRRWDSCGGGHVLL